MNITVMGTGYVGLVSGTCFSEFGLTVTCVDKDASKIDLLNRGDVPIYEPGLQSLIDSNVKARRLFFTTDAATAIEKADVVFIAVGTPMSSTGEADLTFVFEAAKTIAENVQGYTVVVTKSTVPVDTGEKIQQYIQNINPHASFDMVSNPEFLREGSAIEDFMRPNRIVIGSKSPRAMDVMRQLYRPLYLLETPMVVTTLETAELIKYASNAFLATKVAFINEMADLCEQCGADVQAVSVGMGLDKRIGKKFLHAGPGYGGSCFPKDTLALAHTAGTFQTPSKIVEAVIHSNTQRKKRMASKIIQACGGSVEGKKIGVLGVTFKPNTDDMRDAPSLDIIPVLQENGAHIHAFDPEGMEEAQRFLSQVTWHKNAYDAAQDIDILTLFTEWNEFRALDLDHLKTLMKTPVFVDFRNVYDPKEMGKKGFHYFSMGRPAVEPSLLVSGDLERAV